MSPPIKSVFIKPISGDVSEDGKAIFIKVEAGADKEPVNLVANFRDISEMFFLLGRLHTKACKILANPHKWATPWHHMADSVQIMESSVSDKVLFTFGFGGEMEMSLGLPKGKLYELREQINLLIENNESPDVLNIPRTV